VRALPGVPPGGTSASIEQTSQRCPAEDALLLDTTELSIEAAVEQAAKAVEDRMRQGRA